MSDGKQQYWPSDEPYKHTGCCTLETRASIALSLICQWGTVAGINMDREDKSGRAVMDLQPPEVLVERCFRIADLFVDQAEQRGEIKPLPEKEPKKVFGTNAEPYSEPK